MPELPEVETMRRGLLPIVGGRIDDACRTPCPRKPIAITPRIDHFRRRVVGCRVDSAKRCDLMRAAQWQRIHNAIGQILHAAIAHEGSTLSDGTYRNAISPPGGPIMQKPDFAARVA